MTTRTNKRENIYDVYIGRGSIFGNPYVIGVDGSKEQVIARYKEWFKFLLRDRIFKESVLKLKDKCLGCFCNDYEPCHGDVIIQYLDDNSNF